MRQVMGRIIWWVILRIGHSRESPWAGKRLAGRRNSCWGVGWLARRLRSQIATKKLGRE